MIIEVSKFRLVPGTDVEAFLEAAEVSQREFLARQEGFVGRELMQSEDGSWLDLVRFESHEAARNAFAAFAGHPGVAAFERMLDVSTVSMSHWSTDRSW